MARTGHDLGAAFGIEAMQPASTSPVVLSGAYVNGDCIGAMWAFNGLAGSPGSFLLSDLTLVDLSNTKIALDLVFFRGAPAAQTDNSPPTLTLTAAKAIAIVSVPASQWVTVGAEAMAILSNLALFRRIDQAELYFIVIARASITLQTGQLTIIGGGSKD